jgi:hypothetical protein
MAYTAGGYDSDVEGGGPYEGNIGGAFTDKAVRYRVGIHKTSLANS